MGVLLEHIKLAGSKGEKSVETLFDSGASFSFIDPDVAKKLGMIDSLPKFLDFETAEKGKKIRVNKVVRLDFYIDGIRLSDEFLLVENLSEEAIIGATTMQKWRLKLDFEQEKVIVDKRVTRMMLK